MTEPDDNIAETLRRAAELLEESQHAYDNLELNALEHPDWTLAQLLEHQANDDTLPERMRRTAAAMHAHITSNDDNPQ
jgi:hypothetical protein